MRIQKLILVVVGGLIVLNILSAYPVSRWALDNALAQPASISARDLLQPASFFAQTPIPPGCPGSDVLGPPPVGTVCPDPPSETCEGFSFSNGLSFGWLLCPLVNALGGAIQNIFEWVLGPSEEGSGEYCNLTIQFEESDGNCANASFDTTTVKSVWGAFRTLANAFFAIAFLYAIYEVAFATGGNAYSIRKVLPRLGIAAILVQLSFFLSQFVVELINDVGTGIDGIFDFVFQGQDFDVGAILFGGDDSFADHLANGGILILGVSFAWVAGLISVSAILLSLVITLLIIFFVLVLRKLIILVLMVVAPIAAVAWIHPQTDGFAKAWWQIFSKALLMYPLIVLLLKTGELMARATGGASESNAFDLVRFIAYFAPYFLIPFTFRFAGGLIGQVAGNFDRVKGGVVDNRRKIARDKAAERRKNAVDTVKSGALFRKAPEGGFRSGLNRASASLLTGSYLPGRFGARREQEAGAEDVGKAMGMVKELQEAGIANDKVLKALSSKRMTYADMKAWADEQEAIGKKGGEGSQGAFEAAQQMRAAMRFDKKRELGAGATLLVASFGLAEDDTYAGLNETVASPSARARILGQAQYMAKSQGRRFDQGPGTFTIDSQGRIVTEVNSEGKVVATARRDSTILKMKPWELSNQTADSMANLAESWTKVINGEIVDKDATPEVQRAQRTAAVESLAQVSQNTDARSRAIAETISSNLEGYVDPSTNKMKVAGQADKVPVGQTRTINVTDASGQSHVVVPGSVAHQYFANQQRFAGRQRVDLSRGEPGTAESTVIDTGGDGDNGNGGSTPGAPTRGGGGGRGSGGGGGSASGSSSPAPVPVQAVVTLGPAQGSITTTPAGARQVQLGAKSYDVEAVPNVGEQFRDESGASHLLVNANAIDTDNRTVSVGGKNLPLLFTKEGLPVVRRDTAPGEEESYQPIVTYIENVSSSGETQRSIVPLQQKPRGVEEGGTGASGLTSEELRQRLIRRPTAENVRSNPVNPSGGNVTPPAQPTQYQNSELPQPSDIIEPEEPSPSSDIANDDENQ